MEVIVHADTLVEGHGWTGTGRCVLPDHIARHLIGIGNAEAYNTKVETVAEKKTDRGSSASQADRASRKKTAKKSGAKRKS